jgi:hypothetical protein
VDSHVRLKAFYVVYAASHVRPKAFYVDSRDAPKG